MKQWNPQTCYYQFNQSYPDEIEYSWILPSSSLHSSVHDSWMASLLENGSLFVHHLSPTSSSFTLYPKEGMKLGQITMGSERLAVTTGKKRVSLVDLESQQFLQSFLFDSSIITLSSTPDFYLILTSHQVLILSSSQLGSIDSCVGFTKWFHHSTHSKDSLLSNSITQSYLSLLLIDLFIIRRTI